MSQNPWIREGRKTAGWSQTELGAKVGVSQVQVSLWENGKANPTDGQRKKLCKLLGIESAPAPKLMTDNPSAEVKKVVMSKPVADDATNPVSRPQTVTNPSLPGKKNHGPALSLDKPKLDNLASEIWKSAERLRNKFKAYEYQNVILPIIVIRRLECVLLMA